MKISYSMNKRNEYYHYAFIRIMDKATHIYIDTYNKIIRVTTSKSSFNKPITITLTLIDKTYQKVYVQELGFSFVIALVDYEYWIEDIKELE